MKKLSVPFVCLVFLAIMFKLSLRSSHSTNSPNSKLVRVVITNENQVKGTAFANPNGEFGVLQAP